jgi:hypothetical protein
MELSEVWNIPKFMEEAGLQLEAVHYFYLPMGDWQGPLGRMGWQDIVGAVTSLRSKIIALCNVTDERIDTVMESLHQEINERHCSWRAGAFIARKP